MKLYRFKNKGYAFENLICSVGHNFKHGYFIAMRYPFVGFGRDIYKSKTKPRFRNLAALALLLALPYAVACIVGLVWMALYTLYTIIGAANVVEGIRETKQLGGLINIASIFCLTVFYLLGIISLVLWLLHTA